MNPLAPLRRFENDSHCSATVAHWLTVILVCLPVPAASASLLVDAHRGNSSQAPENTLASIRAAAGVADLSEMDVRVSKDGQLVLMHDGGVNRTTNGRGGVKTKTLAQLQALDAGSWFSPDFTGETVPTLAQAIDQALTVDVVPLIERKTGTAETYHNEFVRLAVDSSDFRVISFNRRFIDDLNVLNPDYQLGILGGGALTPSKLNRLVSQGADFISWAHGSVRSRATVDLVHSYGLELHVWTVNNPTRMQQLIDLGVDGITTDFPEVLYDLLTPTTSLAGGSGTFPSLAVAEDTVSLTVRMVAEPQAANLLVWLVPWSLLFRRHTQHLKRERAAKRTRLPL